MNGSNFKYCKPHHEQIANSVHLKTVDPLLGRLGDDYMPSCRFPTRCPSDVRQRTYSVGERVFTRRESEYLPRLVQAILAWSVKNGHVPPRDCGDARVNNAKTTAIRDNGDTPGPVVVLRH